MSDPPIVMKIVFDDLSNEGKSLINMIYIVMIMLNVFLIIKIIDIMITRFVQLAFTNKLMSDNYDSDNNINHNYQHFTALHQS